MNPQHRCFGKSKRVYLRVFLTIIKTKLYCKEFRYDTSSFLHFKPICNLFGILIKFTIYPTLSRIGFAILYLIKVLVLTGKFPTELLCREFAYGIYLNKSNGSTETPSKG